jgi:hypothetical protein
MAVPCPGLRPRSRGSTGCSEKQALLPKPAQIGLWSKNVGGIEPLVDQLTLLIQSGLASKLDPLAYLHRVFTSPATNSATTEQAEGQDG